MNVIETPEEIKATDELTMDSTLANHPSPISINPPPKESRQSMYKTKAPTKSEDIQEHSIFLKPKEDHKVSSSRGSQVTN
mmetsp:Transcript_19764/g.19389  ORF Transcript_19764/g.19389 Transcript_19764/m.19389 type:complete len:80 (+) Transcript_19764:14-253(+)